MRRAARFRGVLFIVMDGGGYAEERRWWYFRRYIDRRIRRTDLVHFDACDRGRVAGLARD